MKKSNKEELASVSRYNELRQRYNELEAKYDGLLKASFEADNFQIRRDRDFYRSIIERLLLK